VFVFENSQSSTNGSSTQGVVYIDNVEFSNGSSPSIVRIDHYGDKLGTCALGGNMGSMGGYGGSCSYSLIDSDYKDYANAMYVPYNVNPGWAGIYIIFGGGNDMNDTMEIPSKAGWISVTHDFSEYNYISFYIKAQGITYNPKAIKLELVDSVATRVGLAANITTSWTYKKISLNVFIGLNKAAIKQLNFIFSDTLIAQYNGSKTGAIYIDKVQFEK